MAIALQGSSPSVLTAGILLLSRSRSMGQRYAVEIVGDPTDLTPVQGPALVHSPVLASCGVGRELGAGAMVIVPGPPTEPLAVSLSDNGTGDWFLVDRAGVGTHPVSAAFVRLCRDPRLPVRELGRRLANAMLELGCPPEPALLDLLFNAPTPPLVRLALALRAGRAMTGAAGAPITRLLGASAGLPDPLPRGVKWEALAGLHRAEALRPYLDRVPLRYRHGLEDWLGRIEPVADADPGYAALVAGLLEVGSHLATLPEHGMLSPLNPAMDAVAVGLAPALAATDGGREAGSQLADVFRFLGGRFVDDARYPVVLHAPPPPDERLARWQWFCRAAKEAADTADQLWKRVTDPPQ